MAATTLLVGSASANANNLLAEMNNSVAHSIKNYVQQMSNEFKSSIAATLSQSLIFEANTFKVMQVDPNRSSNPEQHTQGEHKHILSKEFNREQ